MPRGQYDRAAARAKRESEKSNGRVEKVTVDLIEYLQESFDVEFSAEDVIEVHKWVQEALTE